VQDPRFGVWELVVSSFLLLASLELSDANVYEPQIQAHLGTAAYSCENSRLRVWVIGLGWWVSDFTFSVLGLGSGVLGFRCQVWGLGFSDSGLGFEALGSTSCRIGGAPLGAICVLGAISSGELRSRRVRSRRRPARQTPAIRT